MWNRTSEDPLARLLLDEYGLHMLRTPREDATPGDVYDVYDGRVQFPGRLEYFVDPAPAFPSVREGERLADVSGTTSNEIAADVGLGFLDSFLTALGAVGLAGQIRSTVGGSRATGLQFSFENVTRDYVDPFALERALRAQTVTREDTLMRDDHHYYLVIGVFRSDTISVRAVDERKRSVAIDVDALDVVDAGGGVSVTRSADDAITIAGGTSLAFGVQLSRLVYNDRRRRLELDIVQRIFQVRTDEGELPGSAYSTIGTGNDDMFLAVEEP